MDNNKIIDFNKAKAASSNTPSINNINTQRTIDVAEVKDDSNIIDLKDKNNKDLKNKILKDHKKQEKKFEKQKSSNNKSNKISNTREVSIDLLKKEKRHKNINKSIFNISLYIFSFIVLIVIIINLPTFTVSHLNIYNNDQVSTEEIENSINLHKNNNFLFLYFQNLEEKILTNPMIKEAKVKYTFPNIITVKINERKISGYIPYLDKFVYIDSTGKVIDIKDNIMPNIPLIEGLIFSKFSLGNTLEVSNKDSIDSIIELTNILNKYLSNTEIASIDISNLEEIKILTGKVEILIGNIENCDYKIRKAIEIIKQLPDTYGTLDVSSSSNRSVFIPR